MVRVFLFLAVSVLPAVAAAQSLPVLEARLAAHYGKLLAEAQAEDAEVRRDNLSETYADHEKILKGSQAVFEDFMAKECAADAADTCKINLIKNRLALLGYGSQE